MAFVIVFVVTACSHGGGDSIASGNSGLSPVAKVLEGRASANQDLKNKDAATPNQGLDPAAFEPIFVALPSLPRGSLSHHTMTYTGAGLIVAGGMNQNGNTVPEVFVFDERRAKFIALPVSLKDARQQHTANATPGLDGVFGTADDGVLVLGGCQIAQNNPAGLQLLDSVELILPDPNGDGLYQDAMIQELESLPYGLAGHCCSLIHSLSNEKNQEFLIVGGITSGLTHEQAQCPTNESWIYQLQVNSFGEFYGQVLAIAQPSYARQYHSLTEVPGADGQFGTRDDLFVVVGGRGFEVLDSSQQALLGNDLAASAEAIDAIETFEPFTGRWRKALVDGPLRLLDGRFRHRAVSSDRGLLVFGGVNIRDEVQKECLRLELDPLRPQRLFAVSLGQLQQGRELPEIVALDHRWLILGGFERRTGCAVGAVLDTVEMFNPSQIPTFRLLPQRMARPRIYHRAELLEGRVLIVGGFANHSQNQGPDAEFVHRDKMAPE